MIKKIVKNKKQLSIKCSYVSNNNFEDIVTDLMDTAKYHENNCAGLAANQIGYGKKAIVVKINKSFVPMVNPQFIVLYGGYKRLNEYCLSLPGKCVKKRRYKKIKVSYFDPINMIQVPCLKLKNFEARTLQHEMDHLDGILI